MDNDFRVSSDSVVWMIFAILVVGCFVSYHFGYRNGFADERRAGIEDMVLGKNIPVTQSVKGALYGERQNDGEKNGP